MPGAYAHLTMVNRFKTPEALGKIRGLSPERAFQVTRWIRFLELGAVSPDYPYLSLMDEDSKVWADAMHYTRVGDRLKAGIEAVKELTGTSQEKAFVWLLGFASHIAMDVTIHPVVELKVGPYEDNATDHRICEMNQDVFIFEEMNVGPLALAEFIDAGIGRCHAPADSEAIDLDVKEVWLGMINQTSTPLELEQAPPDLDKWHRRFRVMVDDIAEETPLLPCLARHALAGTGVAYPVREDVDSTYISALNTPFGERMDYADIFDKAQESVGWLWSLVIRGVFGVDTEYMEAIHDWNLDTGRRPDGTLEFWRS